MLCFVVYYNFKLFSILFLFYAVTHRYIVDLRSRVCLLFILMSLFFFSSYEGFRFFFFFSYAEKGRPHSSLKSSSTHLTRALDLGRVQLETHFMFYRIRGRHIGPERGGLDFLFSRDFLLFEILVLGGFSGFVTNCGSVGEGGRGALVFFFFFFCGLGGLAL